MKTNIPEKIYIDDFGTAGLSHDWHLEHSYEGDIEYARTDAFIERAVEWLKKNIEDYMYVLYDKDGRPTNNVKVAMLCFEDFKDYMKGE